ncbi:MAG: NapC/NirT family cytochrome c [candidate division Zixibacteria bacterium]|nr:NapC/NirT family cytochrome c [candidate division Zixibacteria bacterium]
MTESTVKRTLFRHPLAAVGGALFLAGGALFLVLLMLDFSAGYDNPYGALVTFIGAPFIVTVGFALFLLSIYVQVRAARKEGKKVRFNLSIDPTDPAYMRNLWLFLGLSAGLILLVAYSGSRAYEATDSNAFCGTTCHQVMEPQYVTYQHSAHARVHCVECHIGPGASFYVRSKVDGIRQLFATALNTYSRPIETPVHNLRPAQETCEGCHWPQQFYGDKLVTRTYYRTEEENPAWTISLMLKIGGGNPRTGRQEGIHWHMLTENRVEYIAMDEKRQTIGWIRSVDINGDTTIYRNTEVDSVDESSVEHEIRRFDCMDCHNRPSHSFQPPATALNLALSTRKISPELPYIRQVGLDLLNEEYEEKAGALQAIATGLHQYYDDDYPEIARDKQELIAQAVAELQSIYGQNFFPEMATDYRVRENNLSHFVNDGCFRCHSETMQDGEGISVPHDCRTCHEIIAQGPSENLSELDQQLIGLDFVHPEDIDEEWKESKCTECHTPDSGY